MPEPPSASDISVAHESIDKIQSHPQDGFDPYQVTFDPSDPANPQSFIESSASGIAGDLEMDFNMSQIEDVLLISLFVAGYCVGPLLWGPLSEQYGRRPVFIYTFVVYTAFQVGAAVAQNTRSILVFRFLGGIFAAAPLTNSGALISDIWDAKTRGKALAIFTLMPPVLLIQKAKKKREETQDDRFYAPMEKDVVTPLQRAERVLARPFVIFIQEPMLIALTTYLSYVLIYNPKYERLVEKYSPNSVPPEHRLEIAIIAGPLFAISFFWFA
ncbi:hypothetical protein H0H92_003537 [Tricholoma furcatifolium]|nr:hypothetical protein H0H92_003537 [Tricholoma furcatifolium]